VRVCGDAAFAERSAKNPRQFFDRALKMFYIGCSTRIRIPRSATARNDMDVLRRKSGKFQSGLGFHTS
jgi:hypothetical protein